MQQHNSGPIMRIFTSPPLLLVLATLFWAGNTVVGRGAFPLIPAFTLSFWRWVVAFCLVLPFGLPAVIRDWNYYRANWPYMMLLALISVTAYNTFLYWALTWTTAINVSLVCATMPIVIFFLSWVLGGQKAEPKQVAGVLLAMAGVLIVISKGDAAILLGLNFNYGDLLVLVSVVCFGIYSILFKKLQANVDQVGLITVFIFFGTIGIVPFYAWDIYQGRFFSVDGRIVLILLYVGLFPSLLSFFFWNKAIEKGGARIAGMFFNLIPVFTALLAVPFLDETLNRLHLAGMALIFAGIYLATLYRARATAAPTMGSFRQGERRV
jgi:drug/metabolite transporter (DMT)-like permease